MTVDVSIECPAWDADLPDAALLARRTVAAAAAAVPPGAALWEVGIVLADDDFQRRLNDRWRGRDRATNVLAFPSFAAGEIPAAGDGGEAVGLGDIVLAHGVVAEEAARDGKRLGDHLSHLVLHGFLHLLGHSHDDDDSALEMETLERSILAGLGIADPYAPVPAASEGSDRSDERRALTE
jgi:probable rRNA maturation factor